MNIKIILKFTLKRYNRFLRSNPSDAEIQQWLQQYPANYKPDRKPWNIDGYVSRETAAREVWAASLDPVGSTDRVTEENPGVRPEVEALTDEADDAVAANLVNDVGLPDVISDEEDRVARFAEALEENRQQGIGSLPADITPPRDPGILEALNEFLLDLYQRDFQQGRARERRLRGNDRQATPLQPTNPPTGGRAPVLLPTGVGTDAPPTLNREEISRRLANGETLGQVLGTEIRTAAQDELLRLDKAQRDLDNALSGVSGGQDSEVVANRLVKGESLADIAGPTLTQTVERATGLSEADQTRIARDQDDLDETTTLLDELERLLALSQDD